MLEYCSVDQKPLSVWPCGPWIVGLLTVTVKFAFRRSIMVKRTSSRMNVIKGGFIKSYMSWEFAPNS
jgi:hypothetical protein